jgi:hypothetical protein
LGAGNPEMLAGRLIEGVLRWRWYFRRRDSVFIAPEVTT